jgi:hypothetical protein
MKLSVILFTNTVHPGCTGMCTHARAHALSRNVTRTRGHIIIHRAKHCKSTMSVIVTLYTNTVHPGCTGMCTHARAHALSRNITRTRGHIITRTNSSGKTLQIDNVSHSDFIYEHRTPRVYGMCTHARAHAPVTEHSPYTGTHNNSC